MFEALQLLQQGNLSQYGHGDAVLGQGEVHRFQGHDVPGGRVLRPVHGPIGTYSVEKQKLEFDASMNFIKKSQFQLPDREGDGKW